MAGTTRIKVKNWERHPPFAPANPYLISGGVNGLNYGRGNGGWIDADGCGMSDASGRGLRMVLPSTSVKGNPIFYHIDSGSNGAVRQDGRAEIIFVAPSTGQLLAMVRYDPSTRKAYSAFLTTTLLRIVLITTDDQGSSVSSDATISLTAGTKYRMVMDAKGVSPTALTAKLYTYADPTATLGSVTASRSDSGYQGTGTAGFMSRYVAMWDGYVCEANYFALGTDRTAGLPEVMSYSADGSLVTLWAREPDNFVGSASYQWQVSTTGFNSGFTNVAAGTGGTTLKLANYPLSGGTDYYFRVAMTDSTGPTTVNSQAIGPIGVKPTYKRVLLADSRGSLNSGAGEYSGDDWTTEQYQAYFMELMQPDRFITYPTNVSQGGMKTDDFTSPSGTRYSTAHAVVVANPACKVDVQLGINDWRFAVTAATFKTNVQNIVAWCLADGASEVWLHDPPMAYEDPASMDVAVQYSTKLDEVEAADTTGKVFRGVGRDAVRASGGYFPLAYDYTGLHVLDRAHSAEAMQRAKAIVLAENETTSESNELIGHWFASGFSTLTQTQVGNEAATAIEESDMAATVDTIDTNQTTNFSAINLSLATITSSVDTALARIGAFTGTGLNTILGFFRAMMRKTAALTPSDVGGTFDNTTDSQEASSEAVASGGGATAAEVWSYGGRTLTNDTIIALPAQQYAARTIIKGNNYGPSGRAFTVTPATGAEWPTDLSAYTWVLTADKHPDNTNTGSASISGTATVTQATAPSQSMYVTLTSTVTGGMATGLYTHSLRGSATGGLVWTIELGTLDVKDDPAV